VLLRERVALPNHFKLVTEEFREGWDFVRSGDAHWLDKKIRRRGCHFIRIAEGSIRSGVGQRPQEAIANALKLTLRCVRVGFNAAEVAHKVYPYQIQKSAILSVSDESASTWMPPQARLSSQAIKLCPQSSNGIPLSDQPQ